MKYSEERKRAVLAKLQNLRIEGTHDPRKVIGDSLDVKSYWRARLGRRRGAFVVLGKDKDSQDEAWGRLAPWHWS